MANARLVSSEAMAPLAMVAHTGTAYSMPGRLWSDVYMATPLTLSGPSTLGSPAFVLGGRLSVDAMDSLLECLYAVASVRAWVMQRLASCTLKPFSLCGCAPCRAASAA